MLLLIIFVVVHRSPICYLSVDVFSHDATSLLNHGLLLLYCATRQIVVSNRCDVQGDIHLARNLQLVETVSRDIMLAAWQDLFLASSTSRLINAIECFERTKSHIQCASIRLRHCSPLVLTQVTSLHQEGRPSLVLEAKLCRKRPAQVTISRALRRCVSISIKFVPVIRSGSKRVAEKCCAVYFVLAMA